MKGKKVKKDTQRISLYRVRLEKDRDLIKERRAANFASSVCEFRLNRCEHIASPVYGYGSSV